MMADKGPKGTQEFNNSRFVVILRLELSTLAWLEWWSVVCASWQAHFSLYNVGTEDNGYQVYLFCQDKCRQLYTLNGHKEKN